MADFVQRLTEFGAIWRHDGILKRPHALLTSGKHSNAFVNTTLATCRPELLTEILAAGSPYRARLPQPPRQQVDWVVGSAVGAITWSYALAQALEAQAGFTEKTDNDQMDLKRFAILPEHTVLVCEDVISTGGSTLKTLAALKNTGCRILPLVAALVNRSGRDELDGFKIEAVATLTVDQWDAAECPLCKQGSEALRPKQNWARLTQKM
ncbi:MAG TPA: phosphoribosyltransferase family protein [Planctomycetota bacterium]|nr:phosphoribosyltransferase family protein [Planctomycetota bacterium]